MDFFEHQERAHRQTGWLVIYYVIAVALIILAVYVAVAGVIAFTTSGRFEVDARLWNPELFAAVCGGTLVLVTLGSLYKIAMLSGGGEVVARSMGGRPVPTNTTVLAERVLLNVVEEMAIASGTPVPPVYLLEDELAINAFAAGTTPQNAVIGITRGAIETLKRDELQGVIAHEFSHILNGDMRLNLWLIGVLNGILLIATVGYILMRTSSRSSYFSSANSNERKGGNPLPLLGFFLYVIGYIGVFFAHLIKSAVSRQREFLADASAVQFTRFPDGIGGALKKIGGLVFHSRLNAANAEEASHMFFGNALANSFLSMLATHPPLEERIRRIDPNFDGHFPDVQPVDHAIEDLINPRTLAARRAATSVQSVHEQALAGAQTLGFQGADVIEQIGAPRDRHIDYAADLVNSLPAEVTAGVRDPLSAVATIYALLLSEEAEVRQKQLDYLASQADARACDETRRVAPAVDRVSAEAKLPLVAMTVPALDHLSTRQLAAFRADVDALIRADNQVSLFEYAVRRLISKRLVPRIEHRQPTGVRYTRLEQLASHIHGLLSTLAHAGTRDEGRAKEAFQKAIQRVRSSQIQFELLSRDQCSQTLVDQALDQMEAASPAIKKQILEACADLISADGQVTIEEGELLRVIADALDCPMPPLLRHEAA